MQFILSSTPIFLSKELAFSASVADLQHLLL